MKLSALNKNRWSCLTACLAVPAGLSLVLLFASCGDKGSEEPAVKPPKPPVESGGGTTTASPSGGQGVASRPTTGTTPSQHFGAVAQHLDLGGEVFGYVDVDGDVEKVVELMQGFLDAAKQEAGDGMPPHLKTLELSKVLANMGLDGIEAMGLSSYKDGDHYHNKGYIHVPAGRKGLLKVLGGDAKPFVAKQLAPKDADLVLEQSLDARAGFELARSLVADLGGPDASAQFMQSVGEVLPQLGLSVADLFRKLDTRITVIGRVHPDKPMEFPGAPVEVPSFDLLIAFDDLGWLYDKVTTEMKKEMPADQQAQLFSAGDGFERIGLPPMPDPDTVIAQPVIHHDIAGKRVLIASTVAFMDECLAGSSNLSESEDFTAASKGLPAEGNGLSYVSGRLMGEYRKLVQEMAELEPDSAEFAITSGMMKLVFPDAKSSEASVMVNTPEGILMASNSGSSAKGAVMTSGVAVVAVVAAIAVPALQTAQRRARDVQAESMRRMRELEAEIEALEEPVPAVPEPVPAPQQP